MTLSELLECAPKLHVDREGNPISYQLNVDVLRYIDSTVSATAKTVETGAGLSTILFEMKGVQHTCIVPEQKLIDRICAFCKEHTIKINSLTFHVGTSENILPSCTVTDVDVVLIDGRHAFPTPFIDWYYSSLMLKVGGVVIIDDIQLYTGALLRDFFMEEEEWSCVQEFSQKTVAFKKLCQGSEKKRTYSSTVYYAE